MSPLAIVVVGEHLAVLIIIFCALLFVGECLLIHRVFLEIFLYVCYLDIQLLDDVRVLITEVEEQVAEEVAVFEAPDKDTASTVKDNVQTYLDDQSDSFQDYIPEESKRIGNAVLEQKDQYVILCVSGDSEGAKEIIEKAFK